MFASWGGPSGKRVRASPGSHQADSRTGIGLNGLGRENGNRGEPIDFHRITSNRRGFRAAAVLFWPAGPSTGVQGGKGSRPSIQGVVRIEDIVLRGYP